MTTPKKALCSILFLSILFFSSNVLAQDSTKVQSDSNLSGVVKVNGVSPLVGVTLPLNNQSHLRLSGFFASDFEGSGQYYISASYVRYSNWIDSDSVDPYWGANFSMLFRGPEFGPGVFLGTEYGLSDYVSVFGELGLNLFIRDINGMNLGMFNSGIGLRVDL